MGLLGSRFCDCKCKCIPCGHVIWLTDGLRAPVRFGRTSAWHSPSIVKSFLVSMAVTDNAGLIHPLAAVLERLASCLSHSTDLGALSALPSEVCFSRLPASLMLSVVQRLMSLQHVAVSRVITLPSTEFMHMQSFGLRIQPHEAKPPCTIMHHHEGAEDNGLFHDCVVEGS